MIYQITYCAIKDIILEDIDWSPSAKDKRDHLKDQKLDMIYEGVPEDLRIVKDKDGFLSLK